MKKAFPLIFIVMLFESYCPVLSATWYVDASMPVSGDGKSVSTAFKTIQEAISAANSSGTIYVNSGTYNENVMINSMTDLEISSLNGSGTTIINGKNDGPGINWFSTCGNSLSITGFTITNCQDTENLQGAVNVQNVVSECSWHQLSLIIQNCVISNNSSCGISITGPIDADVHNNRLVYNAVYGIYTSEVTGNIRNNKIYHNLGGATISGGGSLLFGENDVSYNSGFGVGIGSGGVSSIRNCIINSNGSYGVTGVGALIFFCTIVNNGVGVRSPATIKSSIIWNNTAQFEGTTFTIAYSDIQGGAVGDYNINQDPKFENASGGNFHLRFDSPCIGKAWLSSPITDIEGNSRPNPPGTNPDMGAYEHASDLSLPVELTNFSAVKNDEMIIIQWRVESEFNNLGYNLYRSYGDANVYKKINSSMIASKGNTTLGHTYSFNDITPGLGIIMYKLENINIDGSKMIFGPITCEGGGSGEGNQPFQFTLYQNYPNPFNVSTKICFAIPDESDVKLSLFDVNGNLVKIITEKFYNAGFHQVDLDMQPQTSGIYIYRVESLQHTMAKKLLFVK